MPFIHPALFWTGLAAVSVPILIHLLNRRRFRIRDWAAMKFLLDSIRKNRRRLRIEELILLAIRCLVVALIGATLARYTGCNAMNALGAGKASSQAIVYVLDDSPSMGQQIGSDTLFAGAVADLSRQIEQLSPDNKAAILLTSRIKNPLSGLNFITEKNSVLARLAQLKPSDMRNSLPEAFAEARKMLEGTKESPTKRIFLLSDFRQVDLAGPEQAAEIRKQFADVRKDGIEVIAMDYGRGPNNNLTIESFEQVDKIAIVGAAVRVALSVRNNGKSSVENVEVQLSGQVQVANQLRDIKLPSQVVKSLDPGQTTRLEFPLTCPQAGYAYIRAKLPADELRGDDGACLAMNIRSAMRVLLVDGDRDVTDEAESESYFFIHAIDPNGDGSYGVSADVIGTGALGEVKFDDYDMVVLMSVVGFEPGQPATGKAASGPADAGGFQYPKLTELEQYVRQGGGLVVFMGNKVDPTFYNGPFYAAGGGLMPFPLGSKTQAGRPGGAYEKTRFFRLAPRSIEVDRLVDVFRGQGSGLTNLIRFTTFYHLNEIASAGGSSDAKPPRVLARFSDDQSSAAIVTRQFGQGNVVLFTSTASTKWNDWATSEMDTYPYVMLEMLPAYARPQQALSDRVGRPWVYTMPADFRDAKASLKMPLYPVSDLKTLQPEVNVLKFDGTTEAGVYTLELKPPVGNAMTVLFSRYVDAQEGDLRPGGQGAMTSAFGSDKFLYIPRQGAAGLAVQSSAEREYWQWILAAVLLLLGLEVFLGQRFGHYT